MRLLLAAAALAVLAFPAAAAPPDRGAGFAGADRSVRIHRGDDFRRDDRGNFRDDDRRDRRDRRRGDSALLIHSYGGVSDRAWAPDSFNDWWHDRPDRAYPAWIKRNRSCEREYWSGGGWRC